MQHPLQSHTFLERGEALSKGVGHGAAGTTVAPRFDMEFGSHRVQSAIGTLRWETQLVRVGNIPGSQSPPHLPACPP